MRKSGEISQDLQKLEVECGRLFDSLVEKNEFDFANQVCDGREEDNEVPLDVLKACGEVSELPLLEVRNSITGNVNDYNIISVCKNGIEVIDSEYDIKIIKFEDLGSINDKLVLINEMENLLS